MKRCILILLISLLLGAPSSFATFQCEIALTSKVPWQGSATSETSIEWNAPRSAVTKYLVTGNGRVGGLLPHIKATPTWLQGWWDSEASQAVRRLYPKIPRVRELPWHLLPVDLQDRLIAYSVRAENGLPVDLAVPISYEDAQRAFHSWRAGGIESLFLRGKVPVNLPSGVSLNGRTRPPETYLIDLEAISKRTTYASFGIMNDFNVLEPLPTLMGHNLTPGEVTNVVFMQEKQSGLVEHLSVGSLYQLLNSHPVDGFQIHFRSGEGQIQSSKFFEQIASLARTMGDNNPSFHVHLVELLPMHLLHHDNLSVRMSTAISIVDFLMRVNQLEEYRAIMEGHPIMLRREAVNHTSIWGTLEAHHFHTLLHKLFHLMSEKEGVSEPLNFPFLGESLKGGYVGMHWSTRAPEKYDRLYSWGLHIRSFDENTTTETAAAILNAFESQMSQLLFVQFPPRLEGWLDWDLNQEVYYDKDIDRLAEKLARARWNKPWEVLFEEVEQEKSGFSAVLDDSLKTWLRGATEFRAAGQ